MNKQDLLEGCISDISGPGGKRDYKAFQETFCNRCRNPECVHARWATDKFSARVITQVDRIFNPSQVASIQDPKYAQIPDFINVLQEAIRLESADRLGDWSIPEDPVPFRPEPVQEVEDLVQEMEEVLPESEDIEEPEPEEDEPEALPAPVPFETPPVIAIPQQKNTSVRDGIMIGGDPIPQKKPVAKDDPWAPTPRVVQPGAVIQMGGGDKENS